MSVLMIQILRVLHIFGGIFWVGGMLVSVFVLFPAARRLGRGGGAMMGAVAAVGFPLYMMLAMLIAILSGIALYMHDSAGTAGAWPRSGQGVTFALGGLLAIIGAGIGMAVNMPTGKRLGALGASIGEGGPTAEQGAEMQRLGARIEGASRIIGVLLVLAAICMAVARYVS